MFLNSSISKGVDETPECFWDMIGSLAKKAQPSHILSTWMLPYRKSTCASAWLAWVSGNCVKDVFSSHLSSHLQSWVGHRIPQVWLILVNIDEAGVCGAVKYHLRHTDNHHPSQSSHKIPPHSGSQAKPTAATLVPLSPP